MVRNHNLAKAISDCGWEIFFTLCQLSESLADKLGGAKLESPVIPL